MKHGGEAEVFLVGHPLLLSSSVVSRIGTISASINSGLGSVGFSAFGTSASSGRLMKITCKPLQHPVFGPFSKTDGTLKAARLKVGSLRHRRGAAISKGSAYVSS